MNWYLRVITEHGNRVVKAEGRTNAIKRANEHAFLSGYPKPFGSTDKTIRQRSVTRFGYSNPERTIHYEVFQDA